MSEVRALELRIWAVRSVGLRDCEDEGDDGGDTEADSSAVMPLEGDMFVVMRWMFAMSIQLLLVRSYK